MVIYSDGFLLFHYLLVVDCEANQKQPPEVFYKKGLSLRLYEKETLAQMFSCEFRKKF